MKNMSKKARAYMVCTLVFAILFTSIAYASSEKRVLEAWFNRINIVYNGVDRTVEFAPFVADGTTYVPLRTMSEIFDKHVVWNEETSTATVTDKPNESVAYLENQIIMRDVEIFELHRRIEALEKQLEEKEDEVISVRDLQSELNRRYDRYERIDFEITLRGDERDLEVRIDVDLSRDESRWNGLSNRQTTDYLQDICDDILKEFPDVYIEGYIRDIDSRNDLIVFSTTARGVVRIDEEYSRVDIRDFERDLDDEYYWYFNNIYLQIKLEEHRDEIIFFVNINYEDYEDEWEDLRDLEVRRLMENIASDIEAHFQDKEIAGYVYDIDNRRDIAEYTRTSRGREEFRRY